MREQTEGGRPRDRTLLYKNVEAVRAAAVDGDGGGGGCQVRWVCLKWYLEKVAGLSVAQRYLVRHCHTVSVCPGVRSLTKNATPNPRPGTTWACISELLVSF
ncbi:hypothetical protein IF1G_10128 [Cordyceps javanica]|uniref:Uncharacterized protein n=1 Tax=Cordyceps javanica TaxID=43265 RepID=A0A545UP52_9HYPO|nr:hypothetical protein IF1G_10128 [Cordyceps javanica]